MSGRRRQRRVHHARDARPAARARRDAPSSAGTRRSMARPEKGVMHMAWRRVNARARQPAGRNASWQYMPVHPRRVGGADDFATHRRVSRTKRWRYARAEPDGANAPSVHSRRHPGTPLGRWLGTTTQVDGGRKPWPTGSNDKIKAAPTSPTTSADPSFETQSDESSWRSTNQRWDVADAMTGSRGCAGGTALVGTESPDECSGWPRSLRAVAPIAVAPASRGNE